MKTIDQNPYILMWKVLRTTRNKRSPRVWIQSLTRLVTAGLPEEIWSPDNHVLEILEWQTPIVVQVSLIHNLLAHHPHLVFGQLVTGQLVQCLLQVWFADEIVIVEIFGEKKQNINICFSVLLVKCDAVLSLTVELWFVTDVAGENKDKCVVLRPNNNSVKLQIACILQY